MAKPFFEAGGGIEIGNAVFDGVMPHLKSPLCGVREATEPNDLHGFTLMLKPFRPA
jgi:hypothetical protein